MDYKINLNILIKKINHSKKNKKGFIHKFKKNNDEFNYQ